MEEEAKQPLIACTLTWESGGDKQERVSASLFDDSLVLNAPGFHREIRLTALFRVRAQDYRIMISMVNSEAVLSMIGHLYEDFARKFIRAYNEVLFNESLMNETVHFEAAGSYTNPSGETSNAVFRICETALVVLPDTHSLVRIPYCMIANTDIQPYRMTATDRIGRIFALAKLGYSTDAFLLAYKTRIAALLRQTREKLGEIAPADDRLAAFLMEGLVQPLSEISAISQGYACALEKRLAASAIAEEYQYLRGISGDIAIGVKRGLRGELTGESVMILAPVFEKNAFIMESLGDSAAATYVFRFPKGNAFDATQWRRFLPEFNESMLSVNFRREPVYLSDEALREPQYETYRNALRRLPSLVKLRGMFAGRAAHSGFEAWKRIIETAMQ